MEKSRCIRLLKALSTKEFRAFIRYVQSPFFNRNDRLSSLIVWLEQQNLDGELDKHAAYRSLYGAKATFKEQHIYDHLSALLKLLEGFLAYTVYQDQPLVEKQFLLQSLLDRNSPDLFQKHHSKVRIQMKQDVKETPDKYLQAFRISQHADNFFGHQRKRGVDTQDSLLEIAENLDCFYLSSKLEYACEMLNRNNVINTTYQPVLAEEICTWFEQNPEPYGNIPTIAIYYRIYKTLTESESEVHYAELVRLLDEKSDMFPLTIAREMYVYAINYCTKQINRGNQLYLEKIFLLFQDLLKKEILMEDGHFAHWHFKNIATVGLRLKQYDWVRNFLEDYKEKIHPEHRQNAYNLNLCTLYYEQNRLKEAMRQLQTVTFTDVYYDLSARSLLLKIYFETEDYDSLLYHIKACQTYLRRNKQVSKYQRKIYDNLLKMVKKLTKVYLQRDALKAEEMLDQLKRDIQEIKEIADVKWLRSKVDAYIFRLI